MVSKNRQYHRFALPLLPHIRLFLLPCSHFLHGLHQRLLRPSLPKEAKHLDRQEQRIITSMRGSDVNVGSVSNVGQPVPVTRAVLGGGGCNVVDNRKQSSAVGTIRTVLNVKEIAELKKYHNNSLALNTQGVPERP